MMALPSVMILFLMVNFETESHTTFDLNFRERSLESVFNYGLNLKELQICLVSRVIIRIDDLLYDMNYHSPGPRDQLRCLQAWVLKKAWCRPHWKVPTTQKRNLVEKKKEEERFSKKTNNAGVTKKTNAHHLVRFWRKSDGMVCIGHLEWNRCPSVLLCVWL